jgi:rhodanese-related sulfurtransferase
MIGKVLNLPFKVLGGVARAVQANESKKWTDHAARDAAASQAKKGIDISVPTDFDPGDIHVDGEVASEALSSGCVVDVSDLPVRINGVLHIPMGEVGIRIAELPPNSTVVVIADDQTKSDTVVRFLRHRGLDETWSLRGGSAAWSRTKDPTGDSTI